MGQALAEEAVLSGLRLVRRAPLAVLAWWLVGVLQQLSYQVINPFVADGPQVRVFGGLLVALILEALLLSAVFRAQLRPEKPGLAWLRLGWVEAQMFVLIVVVGLIAVAVAASTTIAVGHLAVLVHGLPGRFWNGVLVAGSLAALLALLRLCPAPAILVDTGQVDFRASWNATRGRYRALVIVVLALGLFGWELGVIWDQAMRLVPPSGDPDAPKIIHISVWPSPHAVLDTAGRELLSMAVLIFLSAAIVAVWRAAKQTVD